MGKQALPVLAGGVGLHSVRLQMDALGLSASAHLRAEAEAKALLMVPSHINSMGHR